MEIALQWDKGEGKWRVKTHNWKLYVTKVKFTDLHITYNMVEFLKAPAVISLWLQNCNEVSVTAVGSTHQKLNYIVLLAHSHLEIYVSQNLD